MEELPNEVLTRILDNLSITDLQTVRLTSSSFTAASGNVLQRRIQEITRVIRSQGFQGQLPQTVKKLEWVQEKLFHPVGIPKSFRILTDHQPCRQYFVGKDQSLIWKLTLDNELLLNNQPVLQVSIMDFAILEAYDHSYICYVTMNGKSYITEYYVNLSILPLSIENSMLIMHNIVEIKYDPYPHGRFPRFFLLDSLQQCYMYNVETSFIIYYTSQVDYIDVQYDHIRLILTNGKEEYYNFRGGKIKSIENIENLMFYTYERNIYYKNEDVKLTIPFNKFIVCLDWLRDIDYSPEGLGDEYDPTKQRIFELNTLFVVTSDKELYKIVIDNRTQQYVIRFVSQIIRYMENGTYLVAP